MPTTPEAAKRRWAGWTKAERRKHMEPAIKAGLEAVYARKVAAARAIVEAAGYRVVEGKAART